jgi:hypothetical protein
MRPLAGLGILCLGLAVAAGCRTDPHVQALERENRILEDQVYAYQDQLQRCCAERDEARRKAGLPQSEPPLEPLSPTPQSRSGRSSNGLSGLRLPQIELPPEPLPAGQIPERFKTGPSSTTPAPLDPRTPDLSPDISLPAPRSRGPGASNASRSRVIPASYVAEGRPDTVRLARITLGEEMTGGYRTGDQGPIEGISVHVEPRTSDDRLMLVSAPVSVVLIDPALPDDQARVARWELSANEVLAMARQTPSGDGLHLDLAWPSDPPRPGRYKLFVRLSTRDGRKLDAQRELVLGVPRAARDDGRPQSIDGWQRKPPAPQPVPTEAAPTLAPVPSPADSPPSSSDRPVWSPNRP